MSKDEDIGYSPQLHEAVHEIVENQIRNGNPKETKATLNRLMNLGYDRHEAIHKIGAIVLEEIFNIMKNQKKFDEKKYVNKLKKLK